MARENFFHPQGCARSLDASIRAQGGKFSQRGIALQQPPTTKQLQRAFLIRDRWAKVRRSGKREALVRSVRMKIAYREASHLWNEQPDRSCRTFKEIAIESQHNDARSEARSSRRSIDND
jgi:hypothetical protein